MIEKNLGITTKDGEMETFICHPERNGPSPAVFLLMDAHGIREELKDMARRLGTVGYYVLLCPISTTARAVTRSMERACTRRAAQSISACVPFAPR